MKLFSTDISSQLTELFNLFISSDVFPLILKPSLLPFKQKCKLKYFNYCPTYLLWNIDKIVETVMHMNFWKSYKFLESINLIYELQFEFWQNTLPAGIYLLKVNNKTLKVNKEDTRTTLLALFWCRYCNFLTNFKPCTSVSIVNFEHVIAGWATSIGIYSHSLFKALSFNLMNLDNIF